MNPDLAMGDELLKKTGAGNLFMVFGEPDIEIRSGPPITQIDADKKKHPRKSASSAGETSDSPIVELRGVDVYDATTGEIRSSSTDDIACWFIDTNYNVPTANPDRRSNSRKCSSQAESPKSRRNTSALTRDERMSARVLMKIVLSYRTIVR
jgi:hypothetical protein